MSFLCIINPRMAEDQFGPPLWFFQKCIIQSEGKTLHFVTFNIILSHIFPEGFFEIPQVVQKI